MTAITKLRQADPQPNDILRRARELSRKFASTAEHIDISGDFPKDNFEALYRAGITRLVTARLHGGEEAGLLMASRVVAEISKG